MGRRISGRGGFLKMSVSLASRPWWPPQGGDCKAGSRRAWLYRGELGAMVILL